MPDRLVSMAELKTLLGIGDLYSDTVLEQIADTATDVILDYLQLNRAWADQICCEDGFILQARTIKPHNLYVGQSVFLEGFPGGNVNGVRTVEEVVDETVVRIDLGIHQAPVIDDPIPLIPPATISDQTRIDYYADVPAVKEAVTAIAVDVFQSRVAPGGQTEAIDFTPGPYRMGRSLVTRVSGLLGRWMDTSALVG
jgi:hypothetical protein